MIVKLEKQMVYAKAELEQQKIQAKITPKQYALNVKNI